MKLTRLFEKIEQPELTFPWLDHEAVKADKTTFVQLITSYRKNSDAEHKAYMKRGSGGDKDWYNTRSEFDKEDKRLEREFISKFVKRGQKSGFSMSFVSDFEASPAKIWQMAVSKA